MRKIVLLISIFALSSCVSVGTSYHNSWNCTQISDSNNYSCRLLPDTYYYNFNTDLNATTYIGPVGKYDNSLQPHGWGEIKFTNISEYKIKFLYGMPKEANITFLDGSRYKGEINQRLKWVKGESRFDGNTFYGTFYFSNEEYYFKQGKLIHPDYTFDGTFYEDVVNARKKGKYKSKTEDLEFDGSFSKNGEMQKGILTSQENLNGESCQRTFQGYINNNDDGWYYNLRPDFTLEHKIGLITKTNGDISVKLQNSSKPVSVSYSNDALKSNTNLVKFDEETGQFSYANFTWENFLSCFSSPEIKEEEIILDGDSDRYFYTEGLSSGENIDEYGFGVRYTANYLDNIKGQLFLVKFKTKAASRNITDVFTQDSKYVSGRREVFNPKYDEVSLEVDRAYIAWQNAERETFDCPYNAANPITCALVSAGYEAAANEAERNYYAAREKLNSTKRTVLENVYSSYEVEKLKITASQNATLVAAIIDFRNGKIFEKEYSLNDSKKFVVINSPVADTDPDKNRIQRNSSKESEVDKWMQNQILLSKSAKTVFDELLQTKPKKKSKRELRSYVDNLVNASSNDSRGKRIATSYRKKNSYELEDSIMVVSNLQGSGTAFYINNNYLITNQHVVEESNFVTLRNQEGDSFTAEVIDTDIATDLALVKSNTEGIPLNIHPTCNIKRREDVFTIGHPVGYEYSTTRGIISAIRTIPNPFYKATGLKKYIQIDAPISPGNSGGPLFNSASEVVGVNTWGDNQGQNLNFAVHCSELKEFLDSNYINY